MAVIFQYFRREPSFWETMVLDVRPAFIEAPSKRPTIRSTNRWLDDPEHRPPETKEL